MSDESVARLAALGLTLPDAPKALANYVPFVLSGGHLILAGQISRAGDGTLLTGKLGAGLSIKDGRKAAEYCCLNLLAQAKAALGSLDRVARVLRVNGFVNAAPDFTDHPAVMNGASDLLVAVLQERGQHTRVAVGVSSLPAGVAVEIDALFAVNVM
jgi:enamine deaminase RidA (YjgF/YER057c/UK114 family)